MNVITIFERMLVETRKHVLRDKGLAAVVAAILTVAAVLDRDE